MPRFPCLYATPSGRIVWTARAARVLAEFERQRVSLPPVPGRRAH
jgi:hypothetical protein